MEEGELHHVSHADESASTTEIISLSTLDPLHTVHTSPSTPELPHGPGELCDRQRHQTGNGAGEERVGLTEGRMAAYTGDLRGTEYGHGKDDNYSPHLHPLPHTCPSKKAVQSTDGCLILAMARTVLDTNPGVGRRDAAGCCNI